MNEFDLKALNWDDNPLFIERSKHIADKIIEHVPLNKNMIAYEYGCGTGLISFNMISLVNHFTLADSSDGMLEVLKQKIQKFDIRSMTVIKTDLVTDNITEDRFDLIYTALTLHHVMDISVLFSKFYGMLNQNAYLSIADLDTEDGDFHGDSFTGHKGFDREYMKKMFESTGFVDVKAETCYKIVREGEGGIRKEYPIFLMTGMKK